jgi:hypothetical protein
MVQDGDRLPEPTAVEAVAADPDIQMVAVTLVGSPFRARPSA